MTNSPLRIVDPGSIAIRAERLGEDGEIARFQICGDLVQATRETFKRVVLELVAEARADRATKFIVDFTHCTDLDTMGIGTLVNVAKRIREGGGLVHATGLAGDIAELFRLTKLDQVISIEEEPANG